jgi:membrane-associated phospholipid phosphatase
VRCRLLKRALQHVLPSGRDLHGHVLVRRLHARLFARLALLLSGLLVGRLHVHRRGVPIDRLTAMTQEVVQRALGRARAAIAALSAASFGALAVAASRKEVSALDREVQAWVQRTRPPFLEVPMELFAFLGSGCVLLVLSGVAYVLLRRARHPLARTLPLIALGAFVLHALAKRLFARPRPNGDPRGFPSGHTLGATVFFGLLVWLIWTSNVGRAWKWTATFGACLLVLGIAYCRLYLNVHWLTDVAGGFASGVAYWMFVLMAIDRPRCLGRTFMTKPRKKAPSGC